MLIDEDLIEWKIFLEEYIFQDFDQICFQNFCDNLWATLSKLLSTCRENSWSFFSKSFLCYSLPDFNRKNFWHSFEKMLLAKVLSQRSKDFSDEEEMFFFDMILNVEISVVISPESYRSFFRNSPAEFSESPSRCPEELFGDKVSWNFYCFTLIFRIEQKLSAI